MWGTSVSIGRSQSMSPPGRPDSTLSIQSFSCGNVVCKGTGLGRSGAPGTLTGSLAKVSIVFPSAIASGPGTMIRLDMVSTEFKSWKGVADIPNVSEAVRKIREVIS